ncbi:MAG: crotonase/enoyl-CoA hydratase family protein [Actinomycetota bacterium]
MSTETDTVLTERRGEILVVTINRPHVRNAVDSPTARRLGQAFVEFDTDESLKVAILTGAEGTFCAGADLKSVGEGTFEPTPPPVAPIDRHDAAAPMGPTYLRLSKPVIAAVAGHAVAGGLELSLWCDLRVVEEDAVFGVYCRRWGVPLIDGGTVRLPRLIGQSHALDMVLTGRPVGAPEAERMGLANRVVPTGTALDVAVVLAEQLARFPQLCLRNDRRSVHDQWDLDFDDAMANEGVLGDRTLRSGETREGARRFSSGRGRGGSFDDL